MQDIYGFRYWIARVVVTIVAILTVTVVAIWIKKYHLGLLN